MKFPYVKRSRLKKITDIAEKRLFELNHLKTEIIDAKNFLKEEIIHNQKALERILESTEKFTKKSRINIFKSTASDAEINKVKEIFNKWGTDKSSKHGYEIIYAHLKNVLPESPRILEIGCGSNDPGIRHAMSKDYLPLASLNALKEIFQSENVEGADIDSNLEKKSEFKVHFLDQFEKNILEKVANGIGEKYDLIIDDGVHDISANYLTLKYFFKLLKPKGVYVIEDVSTALVEGWRYLLKDLNLEEFDVYISSKDFYNSSSTNLNDECAMILKKEGK
jgi:hypothetical protein